MSLLKRSAKNNALWCIGLFFVGLLARACTGLNSPIWLDEAWRIAEAVETSFASAGDLLLLGLRFETSIKLVQYLANLNGGAIRFPYIVLSAVAVPAVFLYVRQAASVLPAVLAAIWVAFSPWHVTYSTELAAYGVGSTLILLMALIAFKEKPSTTEKYFAIFLSLLASVIHLYLAVAAIIFTFINCLGRSSGVRNTYAVAFLIVTIIFLIKLNGRFSGYSDGGPMNFGAGVGWLVGYPIRILASAFLLPIESRWIPTSYDLAQISIVFPIISVLSFLILGAYALREALRNKWWFSKFSVCSNGHQSTKNLAKLKDLSFAVIFVTFIYLQAFLLDAKFIRYIVVIFPLIIGLLSIFVYHHIRRYGVLVQMAIGGAFLINFLCFSLLFEGPKYKANYNNIFEGYHEGCLTRKTLFVNTYFVETTISRYYLEKTECDWMESRAYHDFFIKKKRSTLKAVDAVEGNYDLTREVKDLLKREQYDRVVVVQNRRPKVAKLVRQHLREVGWKDYLEQATGGFTFTSFENSNLDLED